MMGTGAGIRRVRCGEGQPELRWLAEAARHLRRGGLIAYPTETVYGLGCLLQPEALGRIRRFKGREGENKPFLLLVAGRQGVGHLRWTEEARTLADRFWPGPLTLVLQDPDHSFPAAARGAGGGVAVRVSPRTEVQRLLAEVGEPLVSTSANRAGGPALGDPDAVMELLAQDPEEPGNWLLLDGGALAPTPPSTLVDCTSAPPRVLRWGALPRSSLTRVLPEIDD